MLKEQGRQCAYCKRTLYLSTLSLDHILPLSLGGPHSASNLQLTCLQCNLEKGNKLNWKPRHMRNVSYPDELQEPLTQPNY